MHAKQARRVFPDSEWLITHDNKYYRFYVQFACMIFPLFLAAETIALVLRCSFDAPKSKQSCVGMSQQFDVPHNIFGLPFMTKVYFGGKTLASFIVLYYRHNLNPCYSLD